MGEATSISQAHAKCFKSFPNLISAIERSVLDFGDQAPLDRVQEEFDKYKLWAANAGAAHSGERYEISLDYRLREAPFYKTKVLELLRVLNNIVRKAILRLQDDEPPEELSSVGHNSAFDPNPEGDDSDEESETEHSPGEISSNSGDESGLRDFPENVEGSIPARERIGAMTRLLQSIKFTITCLYKMPIRRPAPFARLKEKPPIDESLYQHFDILYVKDKFPELDPEVATRLGKIISRRRQLISYRRSHDERLQIGASAPETTMPAMPIAEQAPPEAIAGEVNRSRAAGSIRPSHAGGKTQLTKATTLRIDALPIETPQALRPPSDAGSVSSRVSSYTGGSLRVEVPPRPKGDNGGKLERFKCPYCFLPQAIKTDDDWKKHVLRDLQPYVCTFPDCDLLEHAFDSRVEWHNHETQRHRGEWFCGIEGRGHPQYAERTDFLAHMKRDHGTTFKDSQLTLLPNMFQLPSGSQGGICNLCKRPSEELQSHVSRHLQQIALFALPRVNENQEVNSHPLGQNANSLADVNRLQDGPSVSQNSGPASAPSRGELSEPTHIQEAHPEGPEIDDPVDQDLVPDALDLPPWGTGTTIAKPSGTKDDPHQEAAQVSGQGHLPETSTKDIPEEQTHRIRMEIKKGVAGEGREGLFVMVTYTIY